MISIESTPRFAAWFQALRDVQAKRRIEARVDALSRGHSGQHRVLQGGVVELKLSFGPGYRVYYTRRGRQVILLLSGGDKSTQQRDIREAIALAAVLHA